MAPHNNYYNKEAMGGVWIRITYSRGKEED